MKQLSINFDLTRAEKINLRDSCRKQLVELALRNSLALTADRLSFSEIIDANIRHPEILSKKVICIYGVWVEDRFKLKQIRFRGKAIVDGDASASKEVLARMFEEHLQEGYLSEPIFYSPNEKFSYACLSTDISLLGFVAEPTKWTQNWTKEKLNDEFRSINDEFRSVNRRG